MTWAHQDKTAIVGVGATPYYVRGQSFPRTINELAGTTILEKRRGQHRGVGGTYLG